MVLLEDLGALVGLVFALGRGRSSASSPATPCWDGIGTLIIGVLLGMIAIFLASR